MLIIGGGVTGLGTARDLAMRGVNVILMTASDVCSGASGRNHGMLHSGARYAVRDPEAAIECVSESKVLKSIANFCVEDTGGLFVHLPQDDPGFPGMFRRACASCGVGIEQLSTREALDMESALAPWFDEVLAVPDAVIDPMSLGLANAYMADRCGADIRTHHQVEDIDLMNGIVRYRDLTNGEVGELRPEVTVNAAGAWTAEVAGMADLHLNVTTSRGTLVVFEGRLVDRLVNRMRMPGDGDIFVPGVGTTVLGTTSSPASSGNDDLPTGAEVSALVEEARAMMPGVVAHRPIRAFTGVRALTPGGLGRDASRNFTIVDHGADMSMAMLSVVGGKLTTYRLMAERISDRIASILGNGSSCRTHLELLNDDDGDEIPEAHRARFCWQYGPMASEVWSSCQDRGAEEICSCQGVLRGEVEHFVGLGAGGMGEIARRTRAGMGYCQGTGCLLRLSSIIGPGAMEAISRERERGLLPVTMGVQMRQSAMRDCLMRVYGVRP